MQEYKVYLYYKTFSTHKVTAENEAEAIEQARARFFQVEDNVDRQIIENIELTGEEETDLLNTEDKEFQPLA